MRFSHSMLWTWRRCRQRFKWQYVDHWRPRGVSQPLMHGRVGHAALAEWYQNMGDQDAAMQAAYEEASVHQDIVDWNLFETVMRRYFQYSLVEDTDMRVVSVERPFYIGVFDDHVLRGRIDVILQRLDGTVWVVDHKFAKKASTHHLPLDPQMTYYVLGARVGPLANRLQQLEAWPVSGFLMNIIRMQMGGIAANQPVLREYGFRPEGTEDLVLAEVAIQMREILEFMRFGERRSQATYRSMDKACRWDCGFYNACTAWLHDGECTSILESNFDRQDYHERID